MHRLTSGSYRFGLRLAACEFNAVGGDEFGGKVKKNSFEKKHFVQRWTQSRGMVLTDDHMESFIGPRWHCARSIYRIWKTILRR